MIRLVGAELDRLRARRSFWVFALAALLIVVAFQTATNSTLRPPTAEQVASQREAYEQTHREWEQQCGPGSPGAAETTPAGDASAEPSSGPDDPDDYCANVPEPQLSDFAYGQQSFADAARSSVQISTLLGALLAFLIGASSIGAEYASGAIGNWLTYVPRRGRVFAAKALAVALATAVVSAVLSAAAVAGPALLARGYDLPLTGLGDVSALAGRSVGLIAMAGLLGFCAALLTKHTVAAVGIALGYAIATSVSSGVLAFSKHAEKVVPWTPQANFQAVLEHDYSYQVIDGTGFGEGSESRTAVLTFEHGLVYSLVLLAAVLAVSLLVFRRRDVG
ncbi:ABC-2 type transport system permease protein [Friedmanniella endophytica]|uniref:ABC-2 type transport system permease protein n=1 Tax=Microlunatus kandeliicorticis TaxID=1759536 RepID=A0A7W3ISK4_9ACTN|nr:ABC transporter permease subunit [Microlunatus kandeliicorticis]MBA8794418.1 ABC-2 type transport system permease protein [Microlunatus kandeliicorticis]